MSLISCLPNYYSMETRWQQNILSMIQMWVVSTIIVGVIVHGWSSCQFCPACVPYWHRHVHHMLSSLDLMHSKLPFQTGSSKMKRTIISCKDLDSIHANKICEKVNYVRLLNDIPSSIKREDDIPSFQSTIYNKNYSLNQGHSTH